MTKITTTTTTLIPMLIVLVFQWKWEPLLYLSSQWLSLLTWCNTWMVSASCNTCLNQVICTRANAQRFVKLQHSPQVRVRRVGRSDLQHTITMSRQRFGASPISNSWIKPQRTRQLNVTRPRNRNFDISGSEFASRFAHSRGLDTHTDDSFTGAV